MPSLARSAAITAGAGITTFGYAAAIERNAFTLRRFDVPVLAPGASPVRVLHISDLHLTAGQRRKQAWIRRLAELKPDLVVNSGDTLSGLDAVPAVLRSLEPLLAFPGVFVPGNNDYYGPRMKSPVRYFRSEGKKIYGPPLPWPQLASALTSRGWTDLTHVRTRMRVGDGVEVALAGTDDPHLRRARYERIAGPADPDAVVRIGVTHSPEPFMLASFARDGYDLVLAGHTHGGQVRVPFGPAIVTNCGMDGRRARWLHSWDERMWFHISAGLGTNPFAPVRFACRPEATVLTLRPRTEG